MHVVLVGSMGVGKSTVGRLLAARLHRPLRDSDDELAATRGVSGRQLALAAGVAELHRWEAAQARRALAAPEPAVLALAASVVDDAGCRAALAEPFVVWLRAAPATLAARAASSGHRRPLGGDTTAALANLDTARADRYAAVADLVVDVEDRSPEDVAASVMRALPAEVAP